MRKRFKSKFLRGLYGELVLTRSFQRFTFFHLMFGVGPALGLGIGLGVAETTTGWLKQAMLTSGGAVLGGVVAWFLPRVLWKLLYRLSRMDSLTEPVEDESPDGAGGPV